MKRILSWLNVKQHACRFWDGMWSRTQERFRRMFVLASIHASLVKCSEDDLQQLGEVNAEFGLAKDVKVLRFPTLLAPLLWKNMEQVRGREHEVHHEDVLAMVKNIPSWLRYGKDEEVESDVRRMLQYVSNRPGAYCDTQPR